MKGSDLQQPDPAVEVHVENVIAVAVTPQPPPVSCMLWRAIFLRAAGTQTAAAKTAAAAAARRW